MVRRIWYFKDVNLLVHENHLRKIVDLEKVLNIWKICKIALVGKLTVIKTLVVPNIIHLIASMSTQ